MELGFIGSFVEPASASAKKSTLNNDIDMEQIAVKKNWLQRLLAKAGFSKVEDAVFDMELHTATGATLTIEREEGAPQVGDKAQPNGEHPMPDGSVIVVEDGVIVEIREKVEEVEGEPTITESAVDTEKGETSAEVEDTASLDAEIEQLKAEIATLKDELEKTKADLDAAKANAKSEDDVRILNAVALAGGEKALAQLSSKFVPDTRMKPSDNAKSELEKKSVSKDDILAKIKSIKH